MNSGKILTNSAWAEHLTQIGLRATATGLDDLIARASKGRGSAPQWLEEMVRAESEARARANLARRLAAARLGRFKPLADFDGNWPKKIDRPRIERALTLDFIAEARNLILLGAHGLGKTRIAKNLVHQAVRAGHTVLFRTAAERIADRSCDSPAPRRQKLHRYGRVSLLVID